MYLPLLLSMSMVSLLLLVIVGDVGVTGVGGDGSDFLTNAGLTPILLKDTGL